jgi:hypothetical protein
VVGFGRSARAATRVRFWDLMVNVLTAAGLGLDYGAIRLDRTTEAWLLAGTHLREVNFEHRGLNDRLDCKDRCSRSWDHFVGTSLRELVEGGPGAPNRSPRDLARRAAEEND